MAVFVLVHGSWHEGSAWKEVIRELEARGHKAFAPTAAGYGKGADKNVTHAKCVQSLVEFIVKNSLTDFILVGHSFGGTFISKVAEAVPERIRRLVFQNGFVVRDGHSVMDESPPATAALFERMANESPDKSFLLPFPVWREAFINDGDLEAAKRTYALLSPEPLQPSKDKLDLKDFYSLDIPKSYINATEDIALPPGEWGWHPRMSNRLGLYRLVQMSGSHEVMFTNPSGLAEKIIEAGRD
ncbi:MAG TPA: alpha/beta hydrolase [Candidatus Acidoferrum sp.]|nr:alpha/beta hydrolase [Candidatus Acidoferrum sp.]